jgi:hypothetical protein
MEITPSLKVTRFAQLEPGDLFIVPNGDEALVAMVAEDPTQNGEQLMLTLGPTFPAGTTGPSIMRCADMTVLSLAKAYELRLPCQPGGWLPSEPAPDKNCILVTEHGAYWRANFDSARTGGFKPCYADIVTGLVHTTGRGPFQQFAMPGGQAAFAVAWEIATIEKEPRVILAYPRPVGVK